jgi:two-component system chemotaxis response regulator CheY
MRTIAEDIGVIANLKNIPVKAAVMNALSVMGFRNVNDIDNDVISHHSGESMNHDLLITDLNLQSASSVDFVMMLKKNIHPKRLSVLLAAQESEREYYLPGLGTGIVDEFIFLPFTMESFKKKIFKCIFNAIAERIRVLVVDDAAPIRNSMGYSLQQLGFKDIDMANSGRDALAMMKLQHYELVITDLNMPQMTGIELVEVMKKDEALSRILVLVVTAENEKSRIIALIKAGVNGYILKPYTVESLQDKILALAAYLL